MDQLVSKLPFPVADLSWERLPEVVDSLELSVDDAKTVLRFVLGNPPDDFESWHI